jgi:hypothetical protein
MNETPHRLRKLLKAPVSQVDYATMNTKIEVPLTEEEWSMLNAAADSISSSPEELARVSLMQRCMVMSEDDEICDRTRGMIGLHFGLN